MAVLSFALLSMPRCLAQYTDDAPDRGVDSSYNDSLGNFSTRALDYLKSNGLGGMEFMLTASSRLFYAELSPFVGVRPIKPIIAGIGIHGSYLAGQGFSNGYYGVHGFGRLVIADAFFLHAEYRLLNGVIPGTKGLPRWVHSPILAIGFSQGFSSYLMLGFAMNPDFQQINPFGSFVYRLGFYF